MRVVMLTNTYLPHVGGVARSVDGFARCLRQQGHRVLVVAPEFADRDEQEPDTVRVAAIQRFNGSDFSVRLPIFGLLAEQMHDLDPQVIHSHHPFLLGDTALRIAAEHNLPLVTTHHTMYEQYTHYTPVQFPLFRRFVVHMATEYANLCQHVIAPSQSVAEVLRERGVVAPITVIPTGIDLRAFGRGSRSVWRKRLGIRPGDFVVGYIGRLAPEKNLEFLAGAVATMLQRRPRTHFMVVGSGPSLDGIVTLFQQRGLSDRLHLTGSLQGQELVDAYHALDVFAFASQSETQGLVLAEAMATGCPVVAVDAPGVREALRDKINGLMLPREDAEAFTAALEEMAALPSTKRRALGRQALAAAAEFDDQRCAQALVLVYQQVLDAWTRARRDVDQWGQVMRRAEAEWNLLSGRAGAIVDAIRDSSG